ncbi:MAG: hypothetical protein IT450_17960 [Phycisphaerales bacterium]|nr:hypothetical protein [Phycisphaerales bacterium]
MNYDAARQIKSGPNSGKWHYTRMNDGAVWPIGPCAEGCSGHATAEEACEHYRQSLFAKMRISGPKAEKWPKNKCAVEWCESEATHLIDITAYRFYEVCESHASRETAEALFPRIGESWHS